MNSELSRKFIVASGIAVVVGIIAVTLALRSHHPASVAQVSKPPDAVSQIPEAPPPVASIPDASAAVVSIPAAPAPVVSQDNVGAKIGDSASSAAVEPKVAADRHPATARISTDTTYRTVAPEATVDSRKKSAGKAVAKSEGGAKRVDELTMPSAPSRTAPDAQEGSTSNEPASSDSESPPS